MMQSYIKILVIHFLLIILSIYRYIYILIVIEYKKRINFELGLKKYIFAKSKHLTDIF